MSADFLVEVGTEELPPKSLLQLAEAFRTGIVKYLREAQLDFSATTVYATPRRLAVLVSGLAEQAPPQEIVVWGPPAKIAFDDAGNPSKATEAFARKNNIDPRELKNAVEHDGKQDKLCHRIRKAGVKTIECAESIVKNALKELPIARRMRWGSKRVEFVRPAHWLVLMYGENCISNAVILDLPATSESRGHRFLSPGIVNIPSPAHYKKSLYDAYVIADFAERRETIRKQVDAAAKKAGGIAIIDDELLDEVNALNEWPTALTGSFDESFLDVPPEALISSMKEHQKYFHIIDGGGKLLPFFITVSNIISKDPQQVIAGNERVIRPRLADAAFFYETDKRSSLEEKRQRLHKIVFQAKLGTLYSKTERVAALAEFLAPLISANSEQAKRAAELSKSDLVSEMVLEFPDLQGLMGRYYALNDGETAEVAEALFEQYLPRFAGDTLPTTSTGTVLALADRIDTLVGIFGIGMTPTGSKDPFALRRASLGVLRLLVEQQIDIDLSEILQKAESLYEKLPTENTAEHVLNYMLERFRAWYEEDNIPTEVFLSVAAKKLSNPLDIHQRVLAVNNFNKLPQAIALAAANKRVSNILAKSDIEALQQVIEAKLESESERSLYSALENVEKTVSPLIEARDYTAALKNMSSLQSSVDGFFDNVMVNVEDKGIRQNRLTILKRMRNLFLEIADISLLVPEK